MKQIFTVALNTFRESVRDKVLYNLVVAVLMLIAASLLIGELSINQERKAMVDLGLSTLLLFGYLIAVFIGTGLVYKEIERRTIYTVLAKPLHRYEFILGKFLGLAATLLVNCTVMVVALMLALLYVRRPSDPSPFGVLPAAFLLYVELLLATALALLFSSFTTPALATFFSIIGYLVCNFTPDLKLFADVLNVERYPALRVTQLVLWTLYYALPNLNNFNFITRTAHGIPVTAAQFGLACFYGVVYLSILLSLTIYVFERRNFK